MGMTLWIHTLEGRNMSRDSDDHTLMYELLDTLDAACVALGVEKLSSFQDMTDLELNVDEEFDDEDDEEDDEDFEDEDDAEEDEEDPETGYSYGIDDMQWFSAATGLETMQALREYIAQGGIKKLDEDETEALLEEFDDCIHQLEGPAKRGGRFNLPVVM